MPDASIKRCCYIGNPQPTRIMKMRADLQGAHSLRNGKKQPPDLCGIGVADRIGQIDHVSSRFSKLACYFYNSRLRHITLKRTAKCRCNTTDNPSLALGGARISFLDDLPELSHRVIR